MWTFSLFFFGCRCFGRGLLGGDIFLRSFLFGRFFHIILPLSRTGIVTAATFEFLTCWNEFVFANLIVSSEKLRTIQVGIRYFTNQFSTDYVSMYAAIIISVVPSILGYVIFQEQIISGMTSGAVKG